MRSNPTPAEFFCILFTLGFVFLFIAFCVVPFFADHMVGEDATWEFHNEMVKDKWIVQNSTGFLNWGETKYYVKTENRTFEVDHNIFDLLFPGEWFGYYVNNETGEVTTEWHI